MEVPKSIYAAKQGMMAYNNNMHNPSYIYMYLMG